MSNKIYDDLAKKFDYLVAEDIENFRFPYSEHNLVHDIIAEYIMDTNDTNKKKVLDIGIGTASLYEKINPSHIELTGIDNCEAMIEIAKLRVPEANIINHNLKKGLPYDLEDEKFDFIVVSYVFMHFDFEFILYFIDLFRNHLAPFGKLLIGDVMFYSQEKKENFIKDHLQDNHLDLYYHVYEDILDRIEDNYDLSFMEINQYTGLIIVEKLYQNALQYEETLVKYNENTEKWKSTHPEKKSE
jgi:putative AdoMet-dependent methyltransferase